MRDKNVFFALIGVVPKVNGITFGNNGRNFLNLCCQFVKTSRRERENVPRKTTCFIRMFMRHFMNVHVGLYIRPREVTHIYVGIINFFVHVQKTQVPMQKR